jgi:hypothetical protein
MVGLLLLLDWMFPSSWSSLPSSPHHAAGDGDGFQWLLKWWPLLVVLSAIAVIVPTLAWFFYKGTRVFVAALSYALYLCMKALFIYMIVKILELLVFTALLGSLPGWATDFWSYMNTMQFLVQQHTVVREAWQVVSVCTSWLPTLPSWT